MGMTRSTKEGLAEWSLSDDMIDNSVAAGTESDGVQIKARTPQFCERAHLFWRFLIHETLLYCREMSIWSFYK
jgi:hypothetical protein